MFNISKYKLASLTKQDIKRRMTILLLVDLFVALLFGAFRFSFNTYHSTVRTGEGEYCIGLFDGQSIEQELFLKNTAKISVGVLPHHGNPDLTVGLEYVLEKDKNKAQGFLPLDDLAEGWTFIQIPTNDVLYSGNAKLSLTSIGMNEDNFLEFLIVPNSLQMYPALSLLLDGTPIPDGRLSSSYISLPFAQAITTFFCVFLTLVLFSFLSTIISYREKQQLLSIGGTLYFFCLIAFFTSLNNVGGWATTQYFFNWNDLGIVPRALVGTLLQLIGVYIDLEVVTIFGLLSIAFMAILEIKLLNSIDVNSKPFLVRMYLLFLCTPFGIITFFRNDFFARFDSVLVVFFLLCCLMVVKHQFVFLVPIFCVIAILVYHEFTLLYVPFVFCILLYKWYKTRERKFLITEIMVSILTVLCTLHGHLK